MRIFSVVPLVAEKKIPPKLPKFLTALLQQSAEFVFCRDFLYLDIHSQLAFNAMDRNKDGFITKGELKLAKKKMSMKDVEEVSRNLTTVLYILFYFNCHFCRVAKQLFFLPTQLTEFLSLMFLPYFF